MAKLSRGEMSSGRPGHLVIDDEARIPSVVLDALPGLRRLVLGEAHKQTRDLRRVRETSTVEQAWDDSREHGRITVAPKMHELHSRIEVLELVGRLRGKNGNGIVEAPLLLKLALGVVGHTSDNQRHCLAR